MSDSALHCCYFLLRTCTGTRICAALLWTAPELLTDELQPTSPTRRTSAASGDRERHAGGASRSLLSFKRWASLKQRSGPRHDPAFVTKMQRADAYSFAIVLYELLSRKGPWGTAFLSARGELNSEHLNTK